MLARHFKPSFTALLTLFIIAGTARAGDVPTLSDPIRYSFYVDGEMVCKYINKRPFVTDVNWGHPLVQQAMTALANAYAGTMSYWEWRSIYRLEKDFAKVREEYGTASEERMAEIDTEMGAIHGRNFIKVLLGEFRDNSKLLQKKLEILAMQMPTVPKGKQQTKLDDADIWGTMTGDGYQKLRWIMSEVYRHRVRLLNKDVTSPLINYAWGEPGHGVKRTEHSVPPFTHAEMRYVFWKYLSADSPTFDADDFEEGLADFIEEQCDPDPNGPDLGYMYNFRGDYNFKPHWTESNAFIWASRDASLTYMAQMRAGQKPDNSYFLRPFASRYAQAKGVWGAYVFYRDEDHQYFRQASESGGGPHIYIETRDVDGNGIFDYRLFKDVMGSGDPGTTGSYALPPERMAEVEPTGGATENFDADAFKNSPDWGFLKAFPTFEERMSRMNTGFDRHTNWGPTFMYNVALHGISDFSVIRPAYSPIVAASYMIDASHGFAMRGPGQFEHPKTKGKPKWMFVMKLRTSDYYDENSLKAGKPFDWDTAYFNEAGLSNDYYVERALDRFGWVPADDMSYALWLVESDGGGSYFPDESGSPFGPGLLDFIKEAMGNDKESTTTEESEDGESKEEEAEEEEPLSTGASPLSGLMGGSADN